MRNFISLLAVLLTGSAFQCESIPVGGLGEGHCENTEWLQEIIDNTEQSGQKGEVIRYYYHGQRVYYVNTCIDCADSMAQVYTCSGNVICQFGGIAGLNTCPDFEDTATHKKVLWQN